MGLVALVCTQLQEFRLQELQPRPAALRLNLQLICLSCECSFGTANVLQATTLSASLKTLAALVEPAGLQVTEA